MADDKKSANTSPRPAQADKLDRRAAALKANLMRRKEQARAREAAPDDKDETGKA